MTTVTLFEHSDFGGESLPLTSSDPDLANSLMDKSLKSWNDQVSSFTIRDYGATPSSGNVVFYGDIQYEVAGIRTPERLVCFRQKAEGGANRGPHVSERMDRGGKPPGR